MNKKELVYEISESANLSLVEARQVLVAFEQSVSEALIQGDTVKLIGFGRFSVVKREKRACRNPQTGKTILVPAKKIVKFKAGKRLVDAVN